MTDVNYDRQKAIDDLLRLMGCTDAKASNCEHVAAVAAMADACYRTAGELFGVKVETQMHIKPGVTGKREGRLR